MASDRAFKYALAPLLTKREWDVDIARRELVTAQSVLAIREREQVELLDILMEARAAVSRAMEHGSTIDLTRYKVLCAYAVEVEQAVAAKQVEVEQSASLCKELLGNLRKEHCALRGMERHRDRLQLEHEADRRRTEFQEADERWVLQQGREGGR